MDIKLMPDKYKAKRKVGAGLKLSKMGLSKLSGKFIAQGNFWAILSIGLLIGVILFCFGLWGYKISLSKNKENLSQRIEELQNQRDLELEADFMDLREKIDNFKNILEKRVYSSNLFKMFEELAIAQARFSDLSADISQLEVNLDLEAVNYAALAEQIVVFEQDSRIKSVDFSEAGLGSDGWVNSSVEIELNSDFLFSE